MSYTGMSVMNNDTSVFMASKPELEKVFFLYRCEH